MPAVAHSQPSMTADEFLAWERAQEGRYEFIEGVVHAMAGASVPHEESTGNLYTALRGALGPRGCMVYHSGVKVPVGNNYFYPDIVVRCRPRDPGFDAITEPVLLAEVLSPSTQQYDQSAKWKFYQRLPSLQSFLLIEQDQVAVHVYRRSGAVWIYSSHVSREDVIVLDDPACSLQVGDLYAGIEGLAQNF